MKLARVVAAVVVSVVVAACGNSTGYGGNPPPPPPPPPPGGHSTTITVANNSFSPAPDTIPAGTITFSWATPSNGHNVTWLTGPGTLPAASATMTSGTYQATLVAGKYTYHCTIHASLGMSGTIVVQ
jgi:plastocyanin